MAISFRNVSTGETISVSNIKAIPDGKYKFSVRGKGCGKKFFNRNICLLHDADVADGTILSVAPEWEPVDTPKVRAPRAPKAKKAEPTPEPATEPEPAGPVVEPTPTTSEPVTSLRDAWESYKNRYPEEVILMRCGDFYETYGCDAQILAKVCSIGLTVRPDGVTIAGFPHRALDTYLPKLIRAGHRVAIFDDTNSEPNTVAPLPIVSAPEPAAEPNMATAATVAALAGVKAKSLAKKYGEMASDIIANTAEILRESVKATVNADDVNKIVDGRMAAWEEKMRSMQVVQTIEVKQPTGITKQMTGVFSKGFKVYVNLVGAKKPLYFYGPAGCGKSYMAKQIADALGLDYYETSQAMFAHDLKGYGDAKGEYVSTPFYKAFSGGGIFFLDEVDASAPEALVVLNNAIANGRFDFPVIGMVTAHENFRVIAAGNTRMTGATLAYTARQCQDTSFKNRFFFELVGYDERIELAIAGGDKDIVEFAHDIRKAARETNILQLCSYRQISDMATLLPCVEGDLKHIIRGSVLQEKEVDEANILYQRLEHKNNPWAKAMAEEIEEMKKEEVW